MSKMNSKYEALFTPWKIGNVEIKNRIVMCPMGGTSLFGWMEHTGNHFDKEAAKFFIDKAKNIILIVIKIVFLSFLVFLSLCSSAIN